MGEQGGHPSVGCKRGKLVESPGELAIDNPSCLGKGFGSFCTKICMERKMMDLAFGAARTVSARGGGWVEDC